MSLLLLLVVIHIRESTKIETSRAKNQREINFDQSFTIAASCLGRNGVQQEVVVREVVKKPATITSSSQKLLAMKYVGLG